MGWIRGLPHSMIRTRIPGIMVEDFGLLQSHAFGIQLPQKPGINPTFPRFLRCKNAETNSNNWRGDLRPDWTMIPENGKNPCFDPPIGIFSEGYRRRFYHQSWGCSGLVVRGEMHPDHLSVGDTLPAKRSRLSTKSYSHKTKS